MSDTGTSPFISFFIFNHPTSIKCFVSWTVGNRLLKPLCSKMLDWLNFRLEEIVGLIQALEKRYLYENKTQLRYNFGPVYNDSFLHISSKAFARTVTVTLISGMYIYWFVTDSTVHLVSSVDTSSSHEPNRNWTDLPNYHEAVVLPEVLKSVVKSNRTGPFTRLSIINLIISSPEPKAHKVSL